MDYFKFAADNARARVYGTFANKHIIHFADRSDADEHIHKGPAFCGHGNTTGLEPWVAGDWAFVNCKACETLKDVVIAAESD